MRPRAARKSASRALELRAHLGEFRFQLRHAPRRIGAARLGGIQFGAPVDVFAMQPVDVRLKAVAPVLMLARPFAGQLQSVFQVLDLLREPAELRADFAQGLFALDDAGVRIRIARKPQPVRPQPDAVARHHRFARAQTPSQPQRLIECFGGVYRRQHGTQHGRTVHLRPQRLLPSPAERGVGRAHDDQMAAIEARQHTR